MKLHSTLLFLALSIGMTFCQNFLTKADQEEILKAHNFLRGQVKPQASNMEEMVWSTELANVAQNYADQCVYAHNGQRNNQQATFSYVGENLAAGSGSANYTQFVNLWYGEVKDYDYPSRTCSAVCGHYTQVVWATSSSVGCGVQRCSQLQNAGPNWVILVCDYGPAGNFRGMSPYLSGAPCSNCPSGKSFCTNNLCSFSATTTAVSPVPTTHSTTIKPSDSPTTRYFESPSTAPPDLSTTESSVSSTTPTIPLSTAPGQQATTPSGVAEIDTTKSVAVATTTNQINEISTTTDFSETKITIATTVDAGDGMTTSSSVIQTTSPPEPNIIQCPVVCSFDYCTARETRTSRCSNPNPPASSNCSSCHVTFCHACYNYRPDAKITSLMNECGTCTSKEVNTYLPFYPYYLSKCFKRWAVCARRWHSHVHKKVYSRYRSQKNFACYNPVCVN